MTKNRIDDALAVVFETTDGHDGRGWYYYEDEYQEEGCVGAFASRGEAETHARSVGYAIWEPSTRHHDPGDEDRHP